MSMFTSEITVESLPLPVDGSGVTQPVSATALPLPTGASTETTLAAIKAKTDNLDVLLSTRTKPADTQLVDGSAHTQPVSGSVSVSNFPATQPISGSVSVSNFPATQPVSGPLTDTQLRVSPVPVSGSVTTTPVVSSSATVAQVALSASTNATLLAANANRKKVVLFAPKSTLYIKFGATASATSFTYVVTAANTLLELTTWVGQIDVFSTVVQTVSVTEMV